MRTISTNLYSINELSDSVKAKVLDKYRYAFCDYFADDIRYDAKECSDMTIEVFDLDRHFIVCSFNKSAVYTARTIVENHGESCISYKAATEFLEYLEKSEHFEDDDKIAVLSGVQDDFCEAMNEYYLDLLNNQYEHCTSDEYIIDMLEGNDYEFTEDGDRYKK